MPTVSVIIPSYNRASLIGKAIQSVSDQTYPDYEIIVVDDGSTDNSSEIIQTLNKQGGKIRYIRQEHMGRSAARNRGLSAAEGEYIAFLDSDDAFLPHKLHVQVTALNNHPDFGMVYSRFLRMDEYGNTVGNDRNVRVALSGWIYPELLFVKGTSITTPSVMVRAHVLREVGGFDETMHVCEDLDLWRRIAKRYKVLQIKEPLVVVRYRAADRLSLEESVRARTIYYEKAMAADPALRKWLGGRLFSEMYWHYGMEGLLERETWLGLRLLMRSAQTDRTQFLKSVGAYMLRLPIFIAGLSLRLLASAKDTQMRRKQGG